MRRLALALLACSLSCSHMQADVRDGGAPPAESDAAPPAGPPPRQQVDLDAGWKFLRPDTPGAETVGFDDSAWTGIDVPHTWNAQDGQMGGNAYYRGVGWYRRHVTLDASQADRRVVVEFDGANLVTDVYVNGTPVGQHRGGYSRFRFDVTAQLHAGDNLLAVKLDNSAQTDVAPLDADYTFFGGIYRGVRLVITNPLHVSTSDHGGPGVYVRAGVDGSLHITTRVQNDGAAEASARVEARVLDASGTEVASASSDAALAAGAGTDVAQTTTMPSPHLWNGRQDPYLYSVVVRVGDSDEVTQSFGVRSCAVDANTGFSLNGTPLDLHGVNVHQDRLDIGWALTDAMIDEDLQLIEEIGATAVRAAHYAHAGHFYDVTDRDGLVVWAEVPLIDNINTSAAFATNVKEQLVELIRQNYNHPSICFWSLSNELTLHAGPDPSGLQQQLGELVHAEDSTRISALASTDATTDRGHTDAIGFNKYFGWYVGTTADFAPWADHVHSAEPSLAFAVTEYGAGASVSFHSDTPHSQDHTEEYQATFHEAHWRAMKSRPFIWGKFVWNMFDFASASRNEGDTPGRNDKGLVTYDRKTRKDAFYFYKANWTDEPFVYIASRRFTPRTRATTPVKVYGTMDSVELKVNGVSLGSKTPSDGVYTWASVTLVHGANTIEAIGTRAGSSTVHDTVTWQLQ